jgi:2-C-methyl-D-erythritol 4-phosphate cytidylyltransferase
MVSAIIVAAGKGNRMSGTVPKQYLKLADRPIVSHTLLAFDSCDIIEDIIFVIPEEDTDFCLKKILLPLKIHTQVRLVSGGHSRQDSVFNGLQAIADKHSLVVIHDGVRPLVTAEMLATCIKGGHETGACILGIPAQDTVKQVEGKGHIENTLNRDTIWLAQTPQVFQYALIRKAHETARRDGIKASDDALLVERIGHPVKILLGSRSNIKITTREDLVIGEAILKSRRGNKR